MSDFSAPSGRKGQAVRGRDVGDRRGRGDLRQQLAGLVDVLDRLQEDDGVGRAAELLDQAALEAQIRPDVAGLGVLVRLGVGVDAGDAARAARQQVRAVALAAGEIDDLEPADPGGDPLVDGEMPPEPVVLRGNVGQRSLAGQLERRHTGRLICLQDRIIGSPGPYSSAPCQRLPRRPPSTSRTSIRATTTPPPRCYDAKWGIDFGEIGQDQVRRKIVKALGEWPDRPFGDSLEIGAGTGYFTLNAMQLGLIERATCTDISAGMIETLATRASEIGAEVSTVVAEAERLPFDDESFDLVMGHAILHHIPDLPRAFAEFGRVLRPGGAIIFCGEPSAYGDRIAAVPKRFGAPIAPLWRRALGAEALAIGSGALSAMATSSSPRSTSTLSGPTSCAR